MEDYSFDDMKSACPNNWLVDALIELYKNELKALRKDLADFEFEQRHPDNWSKEDWADLQDFHSEVHSEICAAKQERQESMSEHFADDYDCNY
jgi:hypothetical protein